MKIYGTLDSGLTIQADWPSHLPHSSHPNSIVLTAKDARELAEKLTEMLDAEDNYDVRDDD